MLIDKYDRLFCYTEVLFYNTTKSSRQFATRITVLLVMSTTDHIESTQLF